MFVGLGEQTKTILLLCWRCDSALVYRSPTVVLPPDPAYPLISLDIHLAGPFKDNSAQHKHTSSSLAHVHIHHEAHAGARLCAGLVCANSRLISADLSAATASASPIRIIALSSPPEYLPADAVHPESAVEAKPPIAPPCHGAQAHSREGMVIPPGPIGALMARLGITSPNARPHGEHQPHHGEHLDDKWEVMSAVHEKEAAHRVMDDWKHQVEEIFRPAGDRILPIIEGGSVRILPVNMDGQFSRPAGVHGHRGDAHPGWKSLEGANGVKKHHHHAHGHGGHPGQPRRFICR